MTWLILNKNNEKNRWSRELTSWISLQDQKLGICDLHLNVFKAVVICTVANCAVRLWLTFVIITMCIFLVDSNARCVVPHTLEAITYARTASSNIRCSIRTHGSSRICCPARRQTMVTAVLIIMVTVATVAPLRQRPHRRRHQRPPLRPRRLTRVLPTRLLISATVWIDWDWIFLSYVNGYDLIIIRICHDINYRSSNKF